MKRFSCWLVLVLLFVEGVGCKRSGESETGAEGIESKLSRVAALVPRGIGQPVVGQPWITDLAIADLDEDGLLDVVFAEGRMNTVGWIRQYPLGEYNEVELAAGIAGAAHVEVVDFDLDGDMDVLVASMGIVTPNDQKIGSVVILENEGAEVFSKRVLVEGIDRVTDVQAGDLDGDGDLDLSVGAFGYFEGEVRWMENLGNWEFENRTLIKLSGCIHAPITDVDGDGDLDIVALISQDWEEIYVFENDGRGTFESRVVFGSPNKDYGSSGIEMVDFDGDGDTDIAYTNGDGFDYATPGSRPWHGAQWLENDGTGRFAFHRIGDFSGSYSPRVVDIDGDGDLDFVTTSAFNDWTQEDAESLVVFENRGDQVFEKQVLANRPTHLIVVDAADMDGDGRVELVTGGLHFYPPFVHVSRVALWEAP
ncbi:FG-GAP repeat domain protein [Verrucomicrobiia bacterium DG1235]|nr:FG-GAP repeat domain protein [Verrucomicrobiae bacterium DG1235]